jgi:hypothetical protein
VVTLGVRSSEGAATCSDGYPYPAARGMITHRNHHVAEKTSVAANVLKIPFAVSWITSRQRISWRHTLSAQKRFIRGGSTALKCKSAALAG